jgi:hypothetical protein
MSDINDPDWPEILRAVQEQLADRVHTSLPGIVKSYDSTTQVASVQLAVQLKGEDGDMKTVPVLDDVPVCWPGGAAGGLHVPLAAGDTVMVLFSESDFSGWWATGSVSAPKMLARHDLHAVAIPGLRREASPMAVTGGHVTLAHSSAVHLGSDLATLAVVLQTSPAAWKTVFDAWTTALPATGAPLTDTLFKTAMTALGTALSSAGWPGNFNATKVKAT